MRMLLLKAVGFAAVGVALTIAAGPIVGILTATAGLTTVPVWVYAFIVNVLLVAATVVALRLEGDGLRSLGLRPTRRRMRELTIGFAVGAVLFALLVLVRAGIVGATWRFSGVNGIPAAVGGLLVALLLLLPEELLFRGYPFQRLVQAVGAWPGILISAVLFGIYHLVGSGMWGIGAFFQVAMPALGGVVFGWAAVRTNGLALPIGLHLGGNWAQAAVISLQPQSDGVPNAIWTARISDVQQQSLYAPDLGAHLPYITTMLVAVVVLRMIIQGQRRIA